MIEIILILILLVLLLFGTFLFTYMTIGAIILRVPFVRTGSDVAKKMVELADVRKGQVVYDLGCGDGKILFFAAEKGGNCIGIERLRPLCWLGRLRNKFHKSSVRFLCKNFYKVDLSDADVIFCYLFPKIMEKFYVEKFKELKKGAKIISNAFKIGSLKEKEKIRFGKSWIYIYEK